MLLEAVNRSEGIDSVARLARKWKNTQPLGYLFWLNIQKSTNDQKGIIRVCREALKALEEGRPREQVGEFLIGAAEKLQDAKYLLRISAKIN